MCDPEALFQMALAENHRNALKLEAAAAYPPVAGGTSTTNTSYPREAAAAADHQYDRARGHEYTDIMSQVYTNHLQAHLDARGEDGDEQQQVGGDHHYHHNHHTEFHQHQVGVGC